MTQWGLDALFNPAKRHMDEEKRRLQSTREEIGDSSGGKRIDLESGKVVIPKSTEGEDTAADVPARNGAQKIGAGKNSAEKNRANGKLSPAAERAARRRARKTAP